MSVVSTKVVASFQYLLDRKLSIKYINTSSILVFWDNLGEIYWRGKRHFSKTLLKNALTNYFKRIYVVVLELMLNYLKDFKRDASNIILINGLQKHNVSHYRRQDKTRIVEKKLSRLESGHASSVKQGKIGKVSNNDLIDGPYRCFSFLKSMKPNKRWQKWVQRAAQAGLKQRLLINERKWLMKCLSLVFMDRFRVA